MGKLNDKQHYSSTFCSISHRYRCLIKWTLIWKSSPKTHYFTICMYSTYLSISVMKTSTWSLLRVQSPIRGPQRAKRVNRHNAASWDITPHRGAGGKTVYEVAAWSASCDWLFRFIVGINLPLPLRKINLIPRRGHLPKIKLDYCSRSD